MFSLSKVHHQTIRRKSAALLNLNSSFLQVRSFPCKKNIHHYEIIIATSARTPHSAIGTCHSFSSWRPNNNNSNNRYNSKSNPFKKLKPPKFSFGAGAAAVSGITLLSKSKGIFAALKLTKFATLGSMLLTVGTYTTIYGFPYAAGMVGLILVHESGHALAMKQLKVPFSPMVFIPFMGAAVSMKESPKKVYDEALIALAGPVMGTAGSFVVWGGGFALDSQLCFALADFGFMINLFNLIPIGMLDGGRIGSALSPYAGVAGVGIAGSMIAMGQVSNPIFYLITMGGAYQTGTRLWNDYNGVVNTSSHLPRNYYNITNSERMRIGCGYFGLIGTLFATMALNERFKKSPERMIFEEKAQRSDISGTGLSNIYRDY